MTPIFRFTTINTYLVKETKSLIVELNRPEARNAINSVMIYELESLFSWPAKHLEINSIVLTGVGDYFSSGLDQDELLKISNQKLEQLLIKLQNIIYGLFFLPQTIIVDLKKGAQGVAAELSIGGDIRVANNNCLLDFNHINNGQVPCCGGVGFLSAILGNSTAKNWNLSAKPMKTSTLMSSGYLLQTYETNTDRCQQLREEINQQSPVARIQAKRSFLEAIRSKLDSAITFEKQFAFAGLSVYDWKESIQAEIDDRETQYSSASNIALLLKKNRDENPLGN